MQEAVLGARLGRWVGEVGGGDPMRCVSCQPARRVRVVLPPPTHTSPLPLAAGACYIRSRQAPAKAILRDCAEMCKGVQHPTRGLFLRAYLCQASGGRAVCL